ncbi:MAG: hypothetical protein A2940_01330 [Candidatus Wildermuthbacteria bacterium RIFCSPLOWO2_01_FULL_48_29]|uniref:Uncharacterized protein n=2 Tax=Candidatus Wildermuthiibacteriota TaxID=1817923 RepID=A0A1G2RKJ6_9BACT|nr:MAG: hypothetical protein A2843_01865 [Candidatus Wildermuthbacteria bacterium RIFCSPHIGHO2_01_FULL_48_27b]OHA73346.1 MAG: hypothetical protein A2940_01330 [Candidatus Wildermuthbacteria bacterium RIFCSPLOWO2_01_FULL_48_29]
MAQRQEPQDDSIIRAAKNLLRELRTNPTHEVHRQIEQLLAQNRELSWLDIGATDTELHGLRYQILLKALESLKANPSLTSYTFTFTRFSVLREEWGFTPRDLGTTAEKLREIAASTPGGKRSRLYRRGTKRSKAP